MSEPTHKGPDGPKASIHCLHVVVLLLSLGLTGGAWWTARSQHQELIESRFARQRDHLIELVRERMQKYEDALWAGTAALQANGGKMSSSQWAAYANSLALDRKYPGINGIGIILRVPRAAAQEFTVLERIERRDFAMHPEHAFDPLYPIVVVEPLRGNEKAVGLDIAFEKNRRTGLERAIAEGNAQVTGPITLVQDQTKTPGFLFYTPFYKDGLSSTAELRQQNFVGAVYAPFVVSKLMLGTLRRDNRRLLIRIADGNEVLFDELNTSTANYDANPVFQETLRIELYGRTWTIEMHTDAVFSAASESNQPTFILVGGLFIDALLLIFFVLLNRARGRAVTYADEVTVELQVVNEELREQQKILMRSNAELEQFAYVASHDLQEPLRMVRSYSELLTTDLEGTLTPDQATDLGYLAEGAERMQTLVDDLLEFSRVDNKHSPYIPKPVHLEQLIDDVVHDLGALLLDAKADLSVVGADIWIQADEGQLRQVIQNLVSNSLKFQQEGATPKVEIGAIASKDSEWKIYVKDNGIGIPKDMQERVFQIFQRLHTRREYKGTGLGLAIVKKIVERHGGAVGIESEQGMGCCMSFTIPMAEGPNTSGAKEGVL